MIILLSPSKTLDFKHPSPVQAHTLPEMLDESQALVTILHKYTPAKLAKLMDISDKLARLNVQRYRDFSTPFTPGNAKQALLAFRGDVYDGLEADSYSEEDFTFAQAHLRILSGLYGLLKPLDLIQPYRLEMGTKLPNARGKDLYAFWGERITQALNRELQGMENKLLINLASEEYFKAVQPKALEGKLLNIVFKEKRKGKLQVIALLAKKARGMMASFIVRKRLTEPDGIKFFREGDYRFDAELSDRSNWVFTR